MRTELAIRFSGLPAIITIQQAEHRWLFTLPIAIQGNGEDIGDRAVVNDILRVKNPVAARSMRSVY